MMRALAAATTVLLTMACSGTPSSTEGTTSSATVGGGGSGANGSGGAGGAGVGAGGVGAGAGGSAQPPTTLVDDGLVVRYFIDEADSGTNPTELVDAAASPMPLALTYLGNMSYTEQDGHRGLSFSAAGMDDRASIAVDGAKIQTRLAGLTTGTIEAVLDIQEVTSNSSRFVHIGFDQEGGWFSMKGHTAEMLIFDWQNRRAGRWTYPFPAAGRVVAHIVLDTNEADFRDRTKGYINGGLLPPLITKPEAATLGEVTTVPDGTHFAVGNREVGGRSIRGAIYYAAVYDVALTAQQVADNARVLLGNDDTPTGSTP